MQSETIELKRQLNEERDRIKRLNVQLQRIANATHIPHSELKQEGLVVELEQKISDLHKSNLGLKSKLVHTQALLTAAQPKRKLAPSIPVPKKPPQRKPLISQFTAENQANLSLERQEIIRLQALVNMLRAKLIEVETVNDTVSKELNTLKSEKQSYFEELLAKVDMEKISIQKQLFGTEKELAILRTHKQNLESENTKLVDEKNIADGDLKETRALLEKEREQRLKLEREALIISPDRNSKSELVIKDLRAQNEILETENARLLKISTSNAAYVEHERVLGAQKRRTEELQRELEKGLVREKQLNIQLESLKLDMDKLRDQYADYAEMKNTCASVSQKLALFEKHEIASVSEIEEAIALIRVRKEKGYDDTMEYLSAFDAQVEIKIQLDKERQHHADTIRDLDNTRLLLKNQEKISKDLRLKLDEVNKRIALLQNEYEIKIEDQARLIDLKQARIARLEGKLQEISQTPVNTHETPLFALVNQENIDLISGQNLIEILVEGAKFSLAALNSATQDVDIVVKGGTTQAKSRDFVDPAHHLTTFVSMDFYDFAPQISHLAIGTSPSYQFHARYKVEVDDFFVEYLSSRMLVMEVWRNVCGEPIKLGSSKFHLQELLDQHECPASQWIRFVCDINSPDGALLGQISFSVRQKTPIIVALEAYRDRTATLEILRDETQPIVETVEVQQYPSNKLVFNFDHLSELILPALVPPSRYNNLYLSFSFYVYGEYITESITIPHKNSSGLSCFSVDLDAELLINVVTSPDFDRYLQSHVLEIVLFAETDIILAVRGGTEQELSNQVLPIGTATINLVELRSGKKVTGAWTLTDNKANELGKISGSIYFNRPYRIGSINPSKNKPVEVLTKAISKNETETPKIEDFVRDRNFGNALSDLSAKRIEEDFAKASMVIGDRLNSLPKENLIVDPKGEEKKQVADNFHQLESLPIGKVREEEDDKEEIIEKANIGKEVESLEISSELDLPIGESSVSLTSEGANGLDPDIVLDYDLSVFSTTEISKNPEVSHESSEENHKFTKTNSSSTEKFGLIENDTNENIDATASNQQLLKDPSKESVTSLPQNFGSEKVKIFQESEESLLENEKASSVILNDPANEVLPPSTDMLSEDKKYEQSLEDAETSVSNEPQVVSSAASQKAESPPLPDSIISIAVDSIDFSSASSDIFSFLRYSIGIKQFFISYSFLSFPSEELESTSLQFSDTDPVVVNFMKEFDLTTLEKGQELTNFLLKTESANIIFTIVSEPPPDDESSECIDFALGAFNIRTATDGSRSDRMESTVKLYLNKELGIIKQSFDEKELQDQIGSIRINMRGLAFLREVIELSQSPVKPKASAPNFKSKSDADKVAPGVSVKGKSGSLFDLGSPTQIQLPISSSFAKPSTGKRNQSFLGSSNNSLPERRPATNRSTTFNDEIESIDELAEHLFDV